MTPKEIKTLIKTLRAAGVTHFKSGDVELILLPSETKPVVPRETKPKEIIIPLDAPHEEDKPIQHKVVELTSLLKLSDTELVDQLFPDHTKYEDDEGATA